MFAFKITIPLILLIIELNVVYNLPLNGDKLQETITPTSTPQTPIKEGSTIESTGTMLTQLTTRNPLKGRDLFEQVNQWNLTNYHDNQLGYYQQVANNFQNQYKQTTYSPYNVNSNGYYNNYNNMQPNNNYNNNNNNYQNNGYGHQTLPSYSKSFNPYITVPDGRPPVTPQVLWYSKYWADLTLPIQVIKSEIF